MTHPITLAALEAVLHLSLAYRSSLWLRIIHNTFHQSNVNITPVKISFSELVKIAYLRALQRNRPIFYKCPQSP